MPRYGSRCRDTLKELDERRLAKSMDDRQIVQPLGRRTRLGKHRSSRACAEAWRRPDGPGPRQRLSNGRAQRLPRRYRLSRVPEPDRAGMRQDPCHLWCPAPRTRSTGTGRREPGGTPAGRLHPVPPSRSLADTSCRAAPGACGNAEGRLRSSISSSANLASWLAPASITRRRASGSVP